jgi:ligand-binding sensor domain-containing protein
MRILLILVTAAGLVWTASAQPPAFRAITTAHGLPSNSVSVITQTRDGVMWFGTKEGLCKYEGGAITLYQPGTAPGALLPSNDVRAIHEDRSGILWIGMFGGGLYRFDRTSGKLAQYVHEAGTNRTLSDNRVLGIHEDRNGVLWISTVNGLNSFERANLFFIRWMSGPEGAGVSENRTWPLAEDRAGNLWIGTLGGGLNRMDHTDSFAVFRNIPGVTNSIAGNSVVDILVDRRGMLWLAVENRGLDHFITGKDDFDRERSDFRHFLQGMNVTCVAEDTSGTIIAGTAGSGLKFVDPTSGIATGVAAAPDTPRALNDNDILDVFVDRRGTLWVGTDGGGVNVVTTDDTPKRAPRQGY